MGLNFKSITKNIGKALSPLPGVDTLASIAGGGGIGGNLTGGVDSLKDVASAPFDAIDSVGDAIGIGGVTDFLNPFNLADGNILGDLGGLLGITDPEKGERALEAMKEGQKEANETLDADTAAQLKQLKNAAKGRSLGQNLDAYDDSMDTAQGMTQQAANLAMRQKNAGSASQVTSNLNPEMQRILSETMQRIQGGAGAALQSSAATRAASNAVAGKAGELWQDAFNNTMQRANNNLNVARTYGQAGNQVGSLAGQQLNADNAPMEDWLNLKNDIAMQRYAGNVGLTQAAGQAAGTDQSLLGGLLGG